MRSLQKLPCPMPLYAAVKGFGCRQVAKKVCIPNSSAIFWQNCNTCNAPIPVLNGRNHRAKGRRQRAKRKMQTITNISVQKIWSILEGVCDPEVPVLTVIDLGIVRDVKVTKANEEETVEVVIT